MRTVCEEEYQTIVTYERDQGIEKVVIAVLQIQLVASLPHPIVFITPFFLHNYEI